jgi:ribosome-binding protein aMBF1 (putative translation factor)
MDLYRHFSASGELLYVGISNSTLQRLGSHRSSDWISEIARIEIERFPDKSAARLAEREAIRSEKPRYNVVHARAVKPRIPRRYKNLFRADLLVRYLAKSGVGQTHLANSIGVTQSCIWQWLNGQTQPTVGKIMALAKLTGITAQEWLGFSSAPETI